MIRIVVKFCKHLEMYEHLSSSIKNAVKSWWITMSHYEFLICSGFGTILLYFLGLLVVIIDGGPWADNCQQCWVYIWRWVERAPELQYIKGRESITLEKVQLIRSQCIATSMSKCTLTHKIHCQIKLGSRWLSQIIPVCYAVVWQNKMFILTWTVHILHWPWYLQLNTSTKCSINMDPMLVFGFWDARSTDGSWRYTCS
jgi:hypothetical protein